MITGIEHFGLAARDTAALCAWYQSALGASVAYDNGKSPATYFLRFADGSMVEIYPMEQDAPEGLPNRTRGYRHIALSVDDFDAAAAHLRALGARPMDMPPAAAPPTQTFFFHDPEGNILHLIKRDKPL